MEQWLGVIALVFSVLGISATGALGFLIKTLAKEEAQKAIDRHVETNCKKHIVSGEKGFELVNRQLERIFDLIKDLSDKLYELKK